MDASVLILKKDLLFNLWRLVKNKKIDAVVEVAKVDVITSLSLPPETL